MYRSHMLPARGRRRYATVGSADAMTVPEARAEARRLLAAFLDTVKNDNGPRTSGHPMDAIAVIRLLMLTGCRFGEVVSLEWDWIRGKRIHLPDSKSGPRTVWLSSAARAVIDAIPRYGPDCVYLFSARPPTRHIDNIEYHWHRIRNEAGLPGLRLRIHPSGRKVWVVQARIEGRSRRIVIARHGEMEFAEARRRARDMLARIRAGGNPADDIQREKKTPTFREFTDEYLRRCEPHWKPSGRKTWPRGSMRPARISRALPTAPSRYCAR